MRFSMPKLGVCLALGLTIFAPLFGASFNPVNDFSNTNPSGAWTYGSLSGVAGPDVSTFAELDQYATNAVAGITCDTSTTPPSGPCGINSWFGAANAGLPPTIAANTTGDYVSYLTLIHPWYDLLMYPGADAFVDLRWTAPSTGYYQVSAQFEGLDFFSSGPSVDVYIFLNTQQILNAAIDGTGGQAPVWLPSAPQYFEAGDTVDFVVGSRGVNVEDGTGLQASFDTVVPEPGTVALLGIGLLGVAALRRKLRPRGGPKP